jgi:thiol-disulfide isomerase/thioredoxin
MIKMKTLLFSLFLFFYISASAQQGSAVISIKFKKEAGESIALKYGPLVNIPVVLDQDGGYSQKIFVDTGFYTIVNKGDALRIYIEPGMDLTITKKDTSYLFTGKGTDENNFLTDLSAEGAKYLPIKWNQLTDKANFMEPANFLSRLDQYKKNSLSFLAAHPINKYFNKVEAAYIDCMARTYILQYLERYGIDPEKEKKYLKEKANGKKPDIREIHVKELNFNDRRTIALRVYAGFDMNNEALYKCSIEYSNLIEGKINRLATTGGNTAASLAGRKIEFTKQVISNKFIKQDLIKKYTPAAVKSGTDADKYVLSTVADKQNVSTGKLAPDFTYNDVNGSPFTLSSLKGNYVYIDVWAQWSGPCKAEEPFLKKIEDKYEHQNIKFVSVSVDRQADLDRWKQSVADDNLQGIQVIADKDLGSDFIQKFNIQDVPHFILIGPDGKVISADAGKPSDPNLQVLLDKLLNKR